LISGDKLTNSAVFEIGRMFGQTYANIEANPFRAQKMMIVDEVFYNVVAIKAQDDCFKYITFRQKLPKTPIKLFGKHLKTWATFEVLPEMSPYNQNHEIIEDIYPIDPEDPPYPIVKFGPKKPMPPLEVIYVDEDHEERYKGELKEIYNESIYENNGAYSELINLNNGEYEYWNLEWYWTLPWQYTEFRLPKDDRYLVTLSWWAPESEMTLWNHDPNGPVANWTGERFKFWYEDCSGPLYIDRATDSIRIYGTFGEGAGDPTATDPYFTNATIYPENMPYTDPRGPFFPQHDQAPEKDFMTFNPAVMDHNQGYPELDYIACPCYIVQTPAEKVFKRMWYEKEWFKDLISSNTPGAWDVVIECFDGSKWEICDVMTLAEWNAIPDYVKIRDQMRIKQYNNPSLADGTPDPDFEPEADIYGPAIVQEFTYMTIDSTEFASGMPLMVQAGSKILLPLAHYDDTYRGLNSFDADNDGLRDAVRVESEATLGIDIDLDGATENMDMDTTELNGNEQVVFVLGPKKLTTGTTLQFFDHVITLEGVSVMGTVSSVQIHVEDNEGISARGSTVDMDMTPANNVKRFYRGVVKNGASAEQPAFYVRLLSADYTSQTARIEVGRMFGQTHANIELNPYRAQKMMIVDEVFYNIVAVKATNDDCFKFITIRQKLPKVPIKIFGFELKYWLPGETLPELSPFNEDHEILVDVQAGWGPEPKCQADKIGPKIPRPPLNITYVEEDEEWRFLGELKEIYNESWNSETGIEDEWWNVEWFHTQPKQYTAFVVPDGELYLMTLAWYAPQAEITLWDGEENPVGNWTYERVKFWYDPMDDTDIYINRVGDMPAVEDTIADYYNRVPNGGDGYPYISTDEIINAVMDYLTDAGPFAPGADPAFTKNDLLDFLMEYLAQ